MTPFNTHPIRISKYLFVVFDIKRKIGLGIFLQKTYNLIYILNIHMGHSTYSGDFELLCTADQRII